MEQEIAAIILMAVVGGVLAGAGLVGSVVAFDNWRKRWPVGGFSSARGGLQDDEIAVPLSGERG